MALDNNGEAAQGDQRCPFCHKELIIKDHLLFCPKCSVFIGDPKTFTGSLPTNDTIKNNSLERGEERMAKKKRSGIWQVAILILILVASFTIYQFKLWTFIVGVDYSSVKELQKEIPFVIYLPKKIPFGYRLKEEATNLNYAKSGKVDSIDFTYRKTGGCIINISLFPINNGFTPNNKTVEELFLSLSSGKNFNNTVVGDQDVYTSKSELILTEKSSTLYQSIAIVTSGTFILRLEYLGPTWLTENEILSIAGSLRPIDNL